MSPDGRSKGPPLFPNFSVYSREGSTFGSFSPLFLLFSSTSSRQIEIWEISYNNQGELIAHPLSQGFSCPRTPQETASMPPTTGNASAPLDTPAVEQLMPLTIVHAFTWPKATDDSFSYLANGFSHGSELLSQIAERLEYKADDVQLVSHCGPMDAHTSLIAQGLRAGDVVRVVRKSAFLPACAGVGDSLAHVAHAPSSAILAQFRDSEFAFECIQNTPCRPILLRMLQLRLGKLPDLQAPCALHSCNVAPELSSMLEEMGAAASTDNILLRDATAADVLRAAVSAAANVAANEAGVLPPPPPPPLRQKQVEKAGADGTQGASSGATEIIALPPLAAVPTVSMRAATVHSGMPGSPVNSEATTASTASAEGDEALNPSSMAGTGNASSSGIAAVRRACSVRSAVFGAASAAALHAAELQAVAERMAAEAAAEAEAEAKAVMVASLGSTSELLNEPAQSEPAQSSLCLQASMSSYETESCYFEDEYSLAGLELCPLSFGEHESMADGSHHPAGNTFRVIEAADEPFGARQMCGPSTNSGAPEASIASSVAVGWRTTQATAGIASASREHGDAAGAMAPHASYALEHSEDVLFEQQGEVGTGCLTRPPFLLTVALTPPCARAPRQDFFDMLLGLGDTFPVIPGHLSSLYESSEEGHPYDYAPPLQRPGGASLPGRGKKLSRGTRKVSSKLPPVNNDMLHLATNELPASTGSGPKRAAKRARARKEDAAVGIACKPPAMAKVSKSASVKSASVNVGSKATGVNGSKATGVKVGGITKGDRYKGAKGQGGSGARVGMADLLLEGAANGGWTMQGIERSYTSSPSTEIFCDLTGELTGLSSRSPSTSPLPSHRS